MSCEKCTNFVFRPWDKLDDDQARRVKIPANIAKAVKYEQGNVLFVCIHHKTMIDLQRSSEHCHMCRKLFVAFQQVAGPGSAAARRKNIVDQYPRPLVYLLTAGNEKDLNAGSLDRLDPLSARCGSLEIRSGLRLKQDSTLLDHPGAVNLFSVFDKESAARDRFTTSSDNLALARYWHRHCMERHSLCSQLTQESRLPHLILDIADPHRPVLTLGNSRIAAYATLSYKWGDGARFLTTTKNYASFQHGLDAHELPRTFADAILLAHDLGFPFLWIDALCIRHDLVDELTEQISMMESIYAASTLTIFAAWGESAHDGLAVQRDPWLIKPSEVVLKLDWNDRQLETTIYFGDWHTRRPVRPRAGVEGPLFTRGWVLQEQALSLRGLIFNNDQISWQCLTLRYDTQESNPSTVVRAPPTEVMAYFSEPTYQGSLIRSPQLHTVNQALATWYPLVADFSARKLTYASDTLPALAGLASPVSRLYRLRYIAGLWSGDIEHGLIWWQEPSPTDRCEEETFRWATWKNKMKSSRRGEQDSKSQELTTTPSNDPASTDMLVSPSWSWISRPGSGKVCFLSKAHILSKAQGGGGAIDVINATITHAPANSGPFGGQVTFGMLTIKAHVQRAKIQIYQIPNDHDPPASRERNIRFALFDDAGSKPKTGQRLGGLIGELYPDDWSLPLYSDDIVLCIFCIQKFFRVGWRDFCLAVTPTSEPNRYRRVGLAVLLNTSLRYMTIPALALKAHQEMVLELV